jgi:NACHT domain
MRRWWTPRAAIIMWVCALLGTVLVFILAKDLDEVVKWASVLGFFVALIGLFDRLTPRVPQNSGSGLAQRLDQATEDLAMAVQEQWRDEEKFRRLQDPFPLPVSWTAPNAAVTDHWENVRGQSPAGEPVHLDGQLDHVVDVFDQVPSGRLVVLGKPGAGKTVLTLRFTLDLLERRQPGDPVPVIFSMASWYPGQQSLHAWMSERLADDYPALSARNPSGSTWAWELVHAGRVLPVLDGLDEIPQSLRGEAMQRLNAAFDRDAPVVLTCRTDEYRDTVDAVDVFTAAAVVELRSLSLDDLADYLPRTTRQIHHHGGDLPTTKWEPVLTYLRENPNQPVAQAVVEVLSTPLMTSMARAAYSDTSADPTDLLDDRFADPDALEEHLLEAFIPAAYSYHSIASDTPSASAWLRYRPQQAQDWLRFLAGHLNQLGTRDLAWWQTVHAVPRLTHGLVTGLVCGLMFALVGELAAGPVFGLAYGLAFGLASGLSFGLGQQSGPSHVEVRFRGTTKLFFHRFAVGLAVGFLLGVAFALPVRAVLAVGLAFGLAVGLHVWLGKPADAARASNPLAVLKQDRTATLAFGLSFALSFGLIYGLSFVFTKHAVGPAFGLGFGLSFVLSFGLAGAAAGAVVGWIAVGRIGAITYSLAGAVVAGLLIIPPTKAIVIGPAVGLMFGLAVGSLIVLSKTWGAFVFSRTWQALRGHQPWRLMKFLADARRRGVLRQAGGVYQFRHARLQDHLIKPGGVHHVRQCAGRSPQSQTEPNEVGRLNLEQSRTTRLRKPSEDTVQEYSPARLTADLDALAARLEWVFLTMQRRVAGIIGVITIPVALIFVFWPLNDETSSGAVAMPARPAVRYCAYVIKEPAAVYPAPNTNTKPIKFKYLDDRIETVDRPHPPEWIVVRTPRDSPGFNWMQTTVLTAAATCTSPGLP